LQKITAVIEKGNFVDALSKAVNVANGQNLQILGNVLLSIDGDTATMRATDIETDLTMPIIGLSAEGSCKLLLNAKGFYDIVRTLRPSEPISIVAEETNVVITQGKTKFKTTTQDVADFPEPKDVDPECIITLKTRDFMRLIGKVKHAIDEKESRYTLQGMFLTVEDGGMLTGVGTDGKRLSKYSVEAGESAAMGVIVPGRAINKLPSIIGDSEQIKITVDSTRVSFATAGATVISRLIEGSYPDYKNVVASSNAHVYTFNRANMIFALKKALIVDSKNGEVDLEFDGEKFQVHAGTDTERVDDSLDVVTSQTTPFTVPFYAKQLLDMLNALDGEQVTIQFPAAGSYGAIIVREGALACVVMPIMRSNG